MTRLQLIGLISESKLNHLFDPPTVLVKILSITICNYYYFIVNRNNELLTWGQGTSVYNSYPSIAINNSNIRSYISRRSVRTGPTFPPTIFANFQTANAYICHQWVLEEGRLFYIATTPVSATLGKDSIPNDALCGNDANASRRGEVSLVGNMPRRA